MTQPSEQGRGINRWLLGSNCFTAALGGLLFGFDTAVINGTIPFITKHFNLTEAMLGWTVSSALLGCIIGALTVGKPGDIFGRKAMLKVMALLFFLSALGTGLSSGLPLFILARFVGGLAIGGASVMAPTYISEISPARLRGRLVATAQLAIVSGILLAFFSNYLLTNTGENNWRYMFLVGGIPALIFFFLLFFVIQSPRWLVIAGRIDEARSVIRRINPSGDVEKEITDIVGSIDQAAVSHSVVLFRRPYRRLVLIGIAVGMFNQLTGINIVMYYSTTIIKSAGFTVNSALWQSVLIGATNLVFTLIAMTLIDRLGRKFLLLMGSVGMSLFLCLFSWAYLGGPGQGHLLLVFLLGFIAVFACSQGAVIWVILSEMFPNNIRARASSLGSFSHWFFNFIFTLLFPIVSKSLGVGYVFLFYAGATILSFFFFWKYLVETKGRSLEEIEKIVLKSN